MTCETGRPVTSYTYWADGQVETVTEKLTDSTTRETSYAYDGAGRLRTVTLPQVAVHQEGNLSPTLDYTYDGFGRVTAVKTMHAFDESSISSEDPADVAIELNAGEAAKTGVKTGDKLDIPDSLRSRAR